MRFRPTFTILMVFAMLIAGVGCNRDKCKRVTCVQGTCIDGTCNCEAGYYGTECNDIINAGIDGNWSLEEQCTAGADGYDVLLAAPSTSMVQVQITGLWGRAVAVAADLGADGTSIAVARQHLGNVEIDATGTFNLARNAMNLQYNVYQIGATQAFDVCTATLTKN